MEELSGLWTGVPQAKPVRATGTQNMTIKTLLPDNRTAFEAAVDLTGARASDLPVDVPLLVRPYEVPETHLPWLAWGLSVDLWDKDWDTNKKRVQTARSLPFHQIKGTQTAIARALEVMDAKALTFIVPPAKTYMMNALTAEERASYLDRFAQLRVYPYVARGVTGKHGCFLGVQAWPTVAGDGSYAGPVNPVSLEGTKYTRTAKLWDKGAETTLTTRTVTLQSVGSFEAFEYDEVILAPKPTAAIHLNAPPKARAFLIDDFGVRQRLVRIPRSADYSYRLGREEYTTVYPKGDLIDVRPQDVAEVHQGQPGALYPGADGQFITGHRLPPSIAWRYLYERWHIHDPTRALDERRRSTHLGYTRLGMPAYHAEVRARITGKRTPRTAGPFATGFFVAATRKPLEDARRGVVVAKALRDKVLINTKTYRLPRAGDRHTVGSLVVGQLNEV
jgi:hypothetical protein